MKEFVRMFSVYADEAGKKTLVSEAIFNKDDAELFAENFAHNYNAKTAVSDKFPDGGYVVFAYGVSSRLILSCYNKKLLEYTFANHKFEQRNFKRKKGV